MGRALTFVALAGVHQLAGYQLVPARVSRHQPVVMEYRLNNYVLPGPLQPLNNQALVKLSKASDKTDGGLFVASTVTEKPREGTVVAAGPGMTHPDTGKLLASPLEEGDYVLMAEYSGEKIDYCGESHMFVDASSVLGVYEGGKVASDSFKPTSDFVLVELAEEASETSSGIVIAAQDTEPASQGQVVAAGAGLMSPEGEVLPMPLSTGDNVFYPKVAGADLLLEGKKFKIVRASECMAKW